MSVFADMKNDVVFRRIFAKHPKLTAALISDIMGYEGDARVEHVELLPVEQVPEIPGFKLSILDVKCRDKLGRIFVVEMQLIHVSGFINRVIYNASKAYVGQLRVGGKYTDLHPVIALSLCDFVIWPHEAQKANSKPLVPMVSRWALHETQTMITDNALHQLQYVFIELPKLDERNVNSNAEKWVYLFRRAQELEASFLQTVPKDSAFYEALELAQEANFTPGELEAYHKVRDEIGQAQQIMEDAFGKGEAKGKAEGEEEGMRKGMEEGLRAGKQEGKIEGLRAAIIDLCDVLGITISGEQKAFLDKASVTELEALRTRIKTNKSWPV